METPPLASSLGVTRFRWTICALLFAATTINRAYLLTLTVIQALIPDMKPAKR